MVSTRNTSTSNTNPPRMRDQPSNADSRPPGTLEAMQANAKEMEALRLTNQCLIEELEQLIRQMRQPQEARQIQEGLDIPPHEGQHNIDAPRGAEIEAESSRARGHRPHLAPGGEGNEATFGGHVGNEELRHPQQETGEQSWEQRFKSLQQGLSRVKEVVRGRAPDTMDTLVQQTESPFTAEVLRYPLPAKFRMPQVEAFDGVKDPVDHLNTYKNQMELHGYQDPVRCRAFATTLKGPALAWFNRLPPSSIPSFRDLSIAFVFHFIGARTYRKQSYHLLTVKQGMQESLKSYVQRFNAESLKVDVPDEKFAITAFIAGLGVQSKDLMFSISKNPKQAWQRCSQRQRSTSTVKRPSYPKNRARPPTKKERDRQTTRTKPQETKQPGRISKEKWRTIPEKAWEPQRSSRPITIRKTTTLFALAVHSLNSLNIASPTRGTK